MRTLPLNVFVETSYVGGNVEFAQSSLQRFAVKHYSTYSAVDVEEKLTSNTFHDSSLNNSFLSETVMKAFRWPP